MTNIDRDKLEVTYRVRKLRNWWKNGIENLTTNRTRCIVTVLIYLLWMVLWGAYLYHLYISVYKLLFHVTFLFMIPLQLLFLLSLVIFNGIPHGYWRFADGCYRAGVVNHIGQPPQLLRVKRDKKTGIYQYELDTSGIPITVFEDKQSELESCNNILIALISEHNDKRRILIHAVPASNKFAASILWSDDYITDDARLALGQGLIKVIYNDLSVQPHVLISGNSGSGKSVLLRCILHQCIRKHYIVYLADLKGGLDYNMYFRSNCVTSFTIDDTIEILHHIVDELHHRMELLSSGEYANIDVYNSKTGNCLPRIIFACDELAELTDKTGASKEDKSKIDEIISLLATISRLGRAFGIHAILSLQRGDANTLPGQIKVNVSCRCCGRADNVLSQIVLDNNSAAEQIPKNARGRFIMHDGTIFQGFWANYF